MEQEIDIEQIRKVFAKDRFATENGAVIEAVGERYARCSMQLTGHHYNAAGGIMGGVHFVLADFTFAVATNWNGCGIFKLYHYLPWGSKGGKADCRGRMCKRGTFYGILPDNNS